MTDRRKASIPAPNAVKPEPSTSQEQSEQRPKRSIIRKSFQGEIYGLCWREENELQKALLASLNDRRRVSADLDSGSNVYRQYAGFVRVSRSMPPSGSSSSTGTYVPRSMPPSSSSSSTGICTRRNAASSQSGCSSAVTSRSTSVDEGIKMEPPEIFSPPLKLTHVKQENKSTKVHAQRKFASNSSLPSTPCASPSKSRHPGQAHVTVPAVFPKTAKTEDFLTFLCLRGSSLLPPHLDFGYPRQDRPLSPRQSTASRSGTTRESTPDVSSSSESDEFTNIRTLKSVHTPLRKAARACASTPETARGLASVQPRSPSKTAKRSPHKGVMKSRKALLVSPVQKQMDRFRTKLHAPLSTRFRRRGLSPEYSSQSKLHNNTQITRSNVAATVTNRRQSSRRSSLADRQSIDNTSVSHSQTQANLKMIRKLRCAKKKLMELKSQIKMEECDDDDEDEDDEDDDDEDYDNVCGSPAKRGKDEIMVCLERGSTKRKVSMKCTGDKKVFKRTMQTNRKAHRRKDSDPDYCEENKRSRTKSKSRKKTVTLPLNNRADHRRRNVASSLARLTASRRLAQLRQRQGSGSVRGLLKRKVLNQTEPPTHVTRRQSSLSDGEHSYASDIKNKTLLEIGLPPLRRKGRTLNTSECGDAQSPATSQSAQLNKSDGDSADKSGVDSADDNLGVMVNIPLFYPTEAEFLDPLQYISAIRSRAESFGMCKIIPPASWKPETKVPDDLRFMSQLQYIHKLYRRWGVSVNETESIRKYLASVNVTLDPPPQVGGIEVDLPRLYQTILRFGGMKSVAEKKTWIKVADTLRVPKLAHDRATRLYDVYCKYLLSYSLLSDSERAKIAQSVAMERQRMIKTHGEQTDGTVKGRSMSVSDFVRLSRNTLYMYYDQEPSVNDVERDYWPFVNDRARHVVVQCAHVDTRNQTGITVINKKDLSYSKHGWNFQNLADHPQTLLQTLGPLTGVTAPTLHLGMLFTTSCWSTDLHRLPYIHCLHSGADIVWYSIPGNEEEAFHEAAKALAPHLVDKTGHWLREDTLMISPEELQKKGVSLGRCVQSAREFVVVFSNCFTATVSCGYSLAESVHFAYPDWLSLGVQLSHMLYESHEPVLFSIESLLYSLAQSPDTSEDVIDILLPHLQFAIDEELVLRKKLQVAGLRAIRYWGDADESMGHASKKRRSMEPVNATCEVSKKICFFSMVVNETDGTVYSLQHALTHIQRKQNLSACRFVYQFTEEELKSLLRSTKERVNKTKRLSVEEPESSLPRTRGGKKT